MKLLSTSSQYLSSTGGGKVYTFMGVAVLVVRRCQERNVSC